MLASIVPEARNNPIPALGMFDGFGVRWKSFLWVVDDGGGVGFCWVLLGFVADCDGEVFAGVDGSIDTGEDAARLVIIISKGVSNMKEKKLKLSKNTCISLFQFQLNCNVDWSSLPQAFSLLSLRARIANI